MRRNWLILVFMWLGLSVAAAEVDDLKSSAKPPAPAGMTQEQFDSLVKSVTDAVTKALQEKPQPKANDTTLTKDETGHNALVQAIATVIERTPSVIAGIPAMFAAIERLPIRLDRSGAGGLDFGAFMLVLIGALVFTWAAEWVANRSLRGLKLQWAERVPQPQGLRALLILNSLELIRLFVVGTAVHFITAIWFKNPSFQAAVMATALDFWFRWRVFVIGSEIMLRPNLPQARIVPVSDENAAQILKWVIRTSGIVSATGFFASLFSAPSVLAAALMINTVIVTITYIAFLRHLYGPVSEWFSGLVNIEGAASGLKLALARNWFAIAVPLLLLVAATRIFGAVTANPGSAEAGLLTINVIVAYIVLQTVLVYVARRPVDPQSNLYHLRPVALRVIHVVAMIIALLMVTNVWAVRAFNVVNAEDWETTLSSWSTVGLIIITAFFVWEAISFISARYSASQSLAHDDNEDSTVAAARATRLQTLMPPFRILMAVVIIVTTVLMVLSSLGINTTPLIAGASVLGLAISFGSQTLVKDIVSGVFFLADDAFRVGEYIDCKSVKGTVEGFTLRSIKLRHQNGQIHTIPFGQLGQITNFSRDWTTVKFPLRFARDTNIDTLRKATKKLGIELAEDPELKDQFITPLKLQGIQEIEDNALVMRFKFTVKPINPGYVQRTAIKRMLTEFPALGLKFASTPGLILQTSPMVEATPQPPTAPKNPEPAEEHEEEAAPATKSG